MILAVDSDLDRVKMYQHAKYPGLRLFPSKVISGQTDAHTQPIDCCSHTTKWLVNILEKFPSKILSYSFPTKQQKTKVK